MWKQEHQMTISPSSRVLPNFTVALSPTHAPTLEVQFYGDFVEDKTTKDSLLERICDQCEWKLIGRPTHGMVQQATALIEQELVSLVNMGALFKNASGAWVYNHKQVRRVEKEQAAIEWNAWRKKPAAKPEEAVETFDGAEDFEDVA